jgi:hypothetical protein
MIKIGTLVDQRVVRRDQEGRALLLDDAPEQAEMSRDGVIQRDYGWMVART